MWIFSVFSNFWAVVKVMSTGNFSCAGAALWALAVLVAPACVDDPATPSANEADVLADAPPDAAPDVAPDVAVDTAPDVEPDLPPPDYGYPLDDVLRLDQLQGVGTHNSYHLRSEPSFIEDWNYSFAPLEVQLGEQGVRQFELDLHRDAALGALRVHHIPFADEESTCVRFVDCLATLKRWSDANPGHHALFVFMEAKDNLDTDKLDGHLGDIDAEILSVWPRRRVLTPDDVQGDHATLREAVNSAGWPTLGASRDKIVFVLLDDGRHRDAYAQGQTTLAGRAMFVTADMDSPIAAILSTGNPGTVAAAHAAHFIVRDKIDGTPLAPEEADGSERDAALAAGIHFVSTDFPVADPVTGYIVRLADGSPSRCNPVTAPPECTSQAIEALPRP